MPPNGEHQSEKMTFVNIARGTKRSRYEIFTYLECFKTVLCPMWSQVSVGSASFSVESIADSNVLSTTPSSFGTLYHIQIPHDHDLIITYST